MTRKLFTLCSATSLLLCVAMCALWARSYRVGTTWGYYAEQGVDGMWHDRYLASQAGELHFVAFRQDAPSYDRRGRFHGSDYAWRASPHGETSWRLAGFSYDHFPHMPAREWRDWGVPYWVLALITGAIPVACVAHRRRSVRHGRGLCKACGYDLRATPERCPECGTAGEAAA
jgi:hypothetical protein